MIAPTSLSPYMPSQVPSYQVSDKGLKKTTQKAIKCLFTTPPAGSVFSRVFKLNIDIVMNYITLFCEMIEMMRLYLTLCYYTAIETPPGPPPFPQLSDLPESFTAAHWHLHSSLSIISVLDVCNIYL